MGLFDNFFKKPVPVPDKTVTEKSAKKSRQSKKTKQNSSVLTEKEKATHAGEPYVNILRMDIDPNDINAGAFELDWNDKFVLNLIRAGYKFREDDTDQMIVDRWFQNVCRNIALEMYEQKQADPINRDGTLRQINSRDIGDGRTEIS